MIPIIWGTRFYGAVDRVQGVFYVATKFGHLWFIPLIPMESWLVFAGSETGNGFRGVPIPMSAKSVLCGWLRAACIIAGPIAILIGMAGLSHGGLDAMLTMLGGFAAIGTFFLSYALTRASHDRARELAALAKLPDELVEALLGGAGPALFQNAARAQAPTGPPRSVRPGDGTSMPARVREDVKCPKCAWRPERKKALWKCDACNARFDTFETRATCPNCSKTFEETACVGCHQMSPHEDWWEKKPERPKTRPVVRKIAPPAKPVKAVAPPPEVEAIDYDPESGL
jgi:hypothetical protein